MTQTEIHLHQTTTLTPEQYVAGLTDFGPGRSKVFGNSADEYLKVHRLGRAEADVTEGSGGIWERLHYDWSDPDRVVLTTTDSNVSGSSSGHTYTFTRRPDGLTDIDVVVVRDGKNLKGRRSASCSGPSAGAFWKGRLKTPSKPSRPGTARGKRAAHHEPDSPHGARRRSRQHRLRDHLRLPREGVRIIDMKPEALAIPVSEVDRAKRFCEKLGIVQLRVGPPAWRRSLLRFGSFLP